jgi:hypothetical protein
MRPGCEWERARLTRSPLHTSCLQHVQGAASKAASRAGSRLHLACYLGTLVPMSRIENIVVERVQTGVRMEKRLLKVLKAFAEYHDLTLGDLLEGIVLHAFDGKTPFRQESLDQIKALKKFYGLDLDSNASHRLKESRQPESSRRQEPKARRS